MKISNVALLIALCPILFAGCVQKENVIAQIGKEKITTENFTERLMAAPPAYQTYINTEPGKKQFVDLLVREKITIESARQAGIDKRKEYKKALQDFKDEQKKQLKDYEDGIMMEMYLREIQASSVNASQQEIDEYYQQNKQDFERPVAVVAKHILVSSKQDAQAVIERINKGESFDEIAKEVSTDKVSAQRGGLIGPFRKGELVKEFEDVVFNLKNGEVSDIVETPFGMHIIKKISEEKLPPVAEDAAKAEIKKIIEKNKFEKWFDDAKKKFNVSVDYSKLDEIKNAESEDASEVNHPDEALAEFSN